MASLPTGGGSKSDFIIGREGAMQHSSLKLRDMYEEVNSANDTRGLSGSFFKQGNGNNGQNASIISVSDGFVSASSSMPSFLTPQGSTDTWIAQEGTFTSQLDEVKNASMVKKRSQVGTSHRRDASSRYVGKLSKQRSGGIVHNSYADDGNGMRKLEEGVEERLETLPLKCSNSGLEGAGGGGEGENPVAAQHNYCNVESDAGDDHHYNGLTIVTRMIAIKVGDSRTTSGGSEPVEKRVDSIEDDYYGKGEDKETKYGVDSDVRKFDGYVAHEYGGCVDNRKEEMTQEHVDEDDDCRCTGDQVNGGKVDAVLCPVTYDDYGDVTYDEYGDEYGDVARDEYGDVARDEYGDVARDEYGDVAGDEYGNVSDNIYVDEDSPYAVLLDMQPRMSLSDTAMYEARREFVMSEAFDSTPCMSKKSPMQDDDCSVSYLGSPECAECADDVSQVKEVYGSTLVDMERVGNSGQVAVPNNSFNRGVGLYWAGGSAEQVGNRVEGEFWEDNQAVEVHPPMDMSTPKVAQFTGASYDNRNASYNNRDEDDDDDSRAFGATLSGDKDEKYGEDVRKTSSAVGSFERRMVDYEDADFDSCEVIPHSSPPCNVSPSPQQKYLENDEFGGVQDEKYVGSDNNCVYCDLSNSHRIPLRLSNDEDGRSFENLAESGGYSDMKNMFRNEMASGSLIRNEKDENGLKYCLSRNVETESCIERVKGFNSFSGVEIRNLDSEAANCSGRVRRAVTSHEEKPISSGEYQDSFCLNGQRKHSSSAQREKIQSYHVSRLTSNVEGSSYSHVSPCSTSSSPSLCLGINMRLANQHRRKNRRANDLASASGSFTSQSIATGSRESNTQTEHKYHCHSNTNRSGDYRGDDDTPKNCSRSLNTFPSNYEAANALFGQFQETKEDNLLSNCRKAVIQQHDDMLKQRRQARQAKNAIHSKQREIKILKRQLDTQRKLTLEMEDRNLALAARNCDTESKLLTVEDKMNFKGEAAKQSIQAAESEVEKLKNCVREMKVKIEAAEAQIAESDIDRDHWLSQKLYLKKQIAQLESESVEMRGSMEALRRENARQLEETESDHSNAICRMTRLLNEEKLSNLETNKILESQTSELEKTIERERQEKTDIAEELSQRNEKLEEKIANFTLEIHQLKTAIKEATKFKAEAMDNRSNKLQLTQCLARLEGIRKSQKEDSLTMENLRVNNEDLERRVEQLQDESRQLEVSLQENQKLKTEADALITEWRSKYESVAIDAEEAKKTLANVKNKNHAISSDCHKLQKVVRARDKALSRATVELQTQLHQAKEAERVRLLDVYELKRVAYENDMETKFEERMEQFKRKCQAKIAKCEEELDQRVAGDARIRELMFAEMSSLHRWKTEMDQWTEMGRKMRQPADDEMLKWKNYMIEQLRQIPGRLERRFLRICQQLPGGFGGTQKTAFSTLTERTKSTNTQMNLSLSNSTKPDPYSMSTRKLNRSVKSSEPAAPGETSSAGVFDKRNFQSPLMTKAHQTNRRSGGAVQGSSGEVFDDYGAADETLDDDNGNLFSRATRNTANMNFRSAGKNGNNFRRLKEVPIAVKNNLLQMGSDKAENRLYKMESENEGEENNLMMLNSGLEDGNLASYRTRSDFQNLSLQSTLQPRNHNTEINTIRSGDSNGSVGRVIKRGHAVVRRDYNNLDRYSVSDMASPDLANGGGVVSRSRSRSCQGQVAVKRRPKDANAENSDPHQSIGQRTTVINTSLLLGASSSRIGEGKDLSKTAQHQLQRRLKESKGTGVLDDSFDRRNANYSDRLIGEAAGKNSAAANGSDRKSRELLRVYSNGSRR